MTSIEIKVICACGTKYKFDVQPVDGHMPQAVKCPSCGANGTAQANTAIREALGVAPAEQPAVVIPVSHASPLRVSLPVAAARPAASASPGAPMHVGAADTSNAGTIWAARGKKALTLAWKGILILLCVVAMLAGFGGKKGKRLRMLTRLASAVIKANDSDSKDEERDQSNLWGEDITLLLIQHTNETEVAEACTSFWRDNYKKKVSFVLTNDVAADDNQIGIIPAHNGCVQIFTGLKWPKEEAEKLTQQLSEKFNTVAVETRDVDFSGAFVFGVFEGGEKKFRVEMQMEGNSLENLKESVRVEGEQWAREHGFKSGKAGFKEFDLSDGDVITQRLGFKLWDKIEWERCLLLTEITNPPPTRPALSVRAAKAR